MSNTQSDNQNTTVESNVRPEYDREIQKIADYVLGYSVDNDSENSEEAWNQMWKNRVTSIDHNILDKVC